MKQTISLLLSLIMILGIFSVACGAAPPDLLSLVGRDPVDSQASQLSPEGQKAYAALVQGIQDFDQTVNIPVVDLTERNKFDDILKEEYPELYIGSLPLGTLHTNPDGESYEEITIPYFQNARDVQLFLDGAPKDGTDYEKALYVHDRLIDETYYVHKDYSSSDSRKATSDCLINHATDAMGYAYATQFLLAQLNITSEVVEGTVTVDGVETPSMWNVVTLEGKPYLTDVFQDDPNGRRHSTSHRYFNLTQREMDQDHTPYNPEMEAGCIFRDLNYYKKSKLYFYSSYEAEQAIQKLPGYQNEFECQFSNSTLARQVLEDFLSGKITTRQNRDAEPSTLHNVISLYYWQ